MIKKTSIISIAIAALIATTGAQTVFHPPGKETARPTEVIPLDFDKRAANSKGSKTSLKSPQKTCTLTVGFKYDPDQLKPSTIRVFNSDYHPNRMYSVKNNTVSAEVPAGIYDVMCSFDNKKKSRTLPDNSNSGEHRHNKRHHRLCRCINSNKPHLLLICQSRRKTVRSTRL